jgi:gas vesicle protein
MAERDGSDFGAFFAGLMIGGVVGAAVALLLAPQSGEETRTMIRDKGIELKEQVEKTAADARVRAEQLAQEAKLKAEEARLRAEQLAQEAKARAEEVQRRGQVLLQEQKAIIQKAVKGEEKPPKKSTSKAKTTKSEESPA